MIEETSRPPQDMSVPKWSISHRQLEPDNTLVRIAFGLLDDYVEHWSKAELADEDINSLINEADQLEHRQTRWTSANTMGTAPGQRSVESRPVGRWSAIGLHRATNDTGQPWVLPPHVRGVLFSPVQHENIIISIVTCSERVRHRGVHELPEISARLLHHRQDLLLIEGRDRIPVELIIIELSRHDLQEIKWMFTCKSIKLDDITTITQGPRNWFASKHHTKEANAIFHDLSPIFFTNLFTADSATKHRTSTSNITHKNHRKGEEPNPGGTQQ